MTKERKADFLGILIASCILLAVSAFIYAGSLIGGKIMSHHKPQSMKEHKR